MIEEIGLICKRLGNTKLPHDVTEKEKVST